MSNTIPSWGITFEDTSSAEHYGIENNGHAESTFAQSVNRVSNWSRRRYLSARATGGGQALPGDEGDQASLTSRLRDVNKREAFVPGDVRVADLETWTGKVLEIADGFFSAELVPGQAGPELVADFEMELLEFDQPIQVGDVVYLTVRTVVGKTGYRNRTSSLRLRRLGLWTKKELEDIKLQAKRERESWEDLIG